MKHRVEYSSVHTVKKNTQKSSFLYLENMKIVISTTLFNLAVFFNFIGNYNLYMKTFF